MRFRSHVLHALLEGFVLRRGHEILNLTLPPKFEHMLYLRPSVAQATLYNYNIGQMQGMSASMNAGPLRAFAVCTKVSVVCVWACECDCVHVITSKKTFVQMKQIDPSNCESGI